MRHWDSNEQFKFIELTHRGRQALWASSFFVYQGAGHVCCMLSVLFKNHALSANSPNQIKSDKYLKHEVYMKFISIMLEGEYKGFQELNTASNFPKSLRYGGYSDLKQSHIILCLEPRREWQELWLNCFKCQLFFNFRKSYCVPVTKTL